MHSLLSWVTRESVPVLDYKLRQLLRCHNAAQFEEMQTELRLAALIAWHAAPISLEPGVRPVVQAHPPRSPDFAIRLPDADVAIEATVLRVGALDAWKRSMHLLRERLAAAVRQACINRQVEVSSSLGLRHDALTRALMRDLLESMRAKAIGSAMLRLGNAEVSIKWREMPVYSVTERTDGMVDLPDDPFPNPDDFAAAFSTSTDPKVNAFGFRQTFLAPTSFWDMLTRSLRNTLDAKRDQLRVEGPSLVALFPRSWPLNNEALLNLINARIWPNSDYSWLTGIGVFRPRLTYLQTEPPAILEISFNPNAAKPPPNALHELAARGQRFAYGQPYFPKRAGDVGAGDA